MKQLFVVVLASLLLSSCGFYKRQYTSGWLISRHHVSANHDISSKSKGVELSASSKEEQIAVKPIIFISPIDTIQPEPKDSTQQSAVPNISPTEPDFYTAPPERDIIDDSQPSHNQQLIQKTFEKRVKNARRGMKFMFGAFGFFLLLVGLAANEIVDNEATLFLSGISLIFSAIGLIFMFYFTYKSFEMIINNPDVKFNADSRSKLILPAVLSIMSSGYIGLICALILAHKNNRNKKKRRNEI